MGLAVLELVNRIVFFRDRGPLVGGLGSLMVGCWLLAVWEMAMFLLLGDA